VFCLICWIQNKEIFIFYKKIKKIFFLKLCNIKCIKEKGSEKTFIYKSFVVIFLIFWIKNIIIFIRDKKNNNNNYNNVEEWKTSKKSLKTESWKISVIVLYFNIQAKLIAFFFFFFFFFFFIFFFFFFFFYLFIYFLLLDLVCGIITIFWYEFWS